MKFFRLVLIISISLLLISCANRSTGHAAIGGGLGGALGGAIGSEAGGRTGAIIGSAAGAAAGAAIATHNYDDNDEYHYHKQKRYRKQKHCPPGLAMQGRC